MGQVVEEMSGYHRDRGGLVVWRPGELMELEGGVETLERKKQGPPRSIRVKEEGIDGRNLENYRSGGRNKK